MEAAAARLRARPGRGGLRRTAHPLGGRRLGAPVPPRGRRLAERRRPVPVDRDEPRRPARRRLLRFRGDARGGRGADLATGRLTVDPGGLPRRAERPGVLDARRDRDRGPDPQRLDRLQPGVRTVGRRPDAARTSRGSRWSPTARTITPSGVPREASTTRPARSTPPPRRRRRSRRSRARPGSVPRSRSSTACRGSRSTRPPRRRPRSSSRRRTATPGPTTRSPTPRDATPAARPWSPHRVARWSRTRTVGTAYRSRRTTARAGS